MQDHDHDRRFRALAESVGRIVARTARAFALAGDRPDLEQEIWLALWHALPRFRGEASETTFAYRVALNTALLWRRGVSRRPSTAVDSETPLAQLVDPRPTPEARALEAERDEMLARGLATLAPIDRSLMLMQLDGLTYQEMSAVLGISTANVGTRLTRSRRELQTIVGGFENVQDQ